MNTDQPPKKIKGPCCVCKETKSERDLCIIQKSEEECFKAIELHKQCLRNNGFKAD